VNKYPRYCMIFLLIDRLSRRLPSRSIAIETEGAFRGESPFFAFTIPQICNLSIESISAVSVHAGASNVCTSSVGGVTWKTALVRKTGALQVCEQVAAR